jgi:hypothetical protein
MMDCDASSQMKFVALAVVALVHGLNLPSIFSMCVRLSLSPILSSSVPLSVAVSLSQARTKEKPVLFLLHLLLSLFLSLSKEGALNQQNQL